MASDSPPAAKQLHRITEPDASDGHLKGCATQSACPYATVMPTRQDMVWCSGGHYELRQSVPSCRLQGCCCCGEQYAADHGRLPGVVAVAVLLDAVVVVSSQCLSWRGFTTPHYFSLAQTHLAKAISDSRGMRKLPYSPC